MNTVSDRKLDANRANAQASTGPKSEAGLAITRFNALKHGLTAAQIVIPGEDPAAYDALRESLVEAYNPVDEIEAMLVERVSQSWWKLQRAGRIESQVIAKLGKEEIFTDDKAAKKFQNFLRYKNSIEREWKHATNELNRLLNIRRKREHDRVSAAAFLASTGPRPDLMEDLGPVLSDCRQAKAEARAA